MEAGNRRVLVAGTSMLYWSVQGSQRFRLFPQYMPALVATPLDGGEAHWSGVIPVPKYRGAIISSGDGLGA